MKAHPNRIIRGLFWDRSLTLVAGCTPVSPGCDHCWSAAEARMRAGHPHPDMKIRGEGLVGSYGFNGHIRLLPKNLDVPGRVRTPKVWCIWNDLFHEDVPFDYMVQAFDRMAQALHHLFLVLTKRPERLAAFCGRYGERWPENVWPGITAENQEWFDRRWPFLKAVSSTCRLISYEPALGPLTLPDDFLSLAHTGIVICGAESGSKARPMHPVWPRAVREQCLAHRVHFFFKGWGEWVGVAPAANYPPDSRIRNRGVAGARCDYGYIYRRRRHDGMGYRYLDGQRWEGWPELKNG